jgi:hypothetical protein
MLFVLRIIGNPQTSTLCGKTENPLKLEQLVTTVNNVTETEEKKEDGGKHSEEE